MLADATLRVYRSDWKIFCAGFLTEAGRQNANLFKMKEQSRHAPIEMVAGYVRDHERFREHAGEGFL